MPIGELMAIDVALSDIEPNRVGYEPGRQMVLTIKGFRTTLIQHQ
jgi:hypothetical protein